MTRFCNEKFLAEIEADDTAIVWFCNEMGILLDEDYYRRIERGMGGDYGRLTYRPDDTWQSMYYDAKNERVLLIDWDNCKSTYYKGTNWGQLIMLKNKVKSRKKFLKTILRGYASNGDDISDLVAGINVHEVQYPYMRAEEFDKARAKCGKSTLGALYYPKVYEAGSEEYKKYISTPKIEMLGTTMIFKSLQDEKDSLEQIKEIREMFNSYKRTVNNGVVRYDFSMDDEVE